MSRGRRRAAGTGARPGPWLVTLLLAACGSRPASRPDTSPIRTLRVGHFPNLTHVQGLVAHNLSRQGRGWFEPRLGGQVSLEWYTYNAGPTAMEALLSGALDLAYVGPGPALNAHLRSTGEEVRALAGAVRGGAALVVQGDGRIRAPADFRGKRVGTPQLGNTQDVSCRAWLKSQGFTVTQLGGDVLVVPTQNPDQLSLFQRGQLDAVWTVEPWVTRLTREAGGSIFLDETDAVTTILVGSAAMLARDPTVARAFIAAHRELTGWIGQHPDETRTLVLAELLADTQMEMNGEVVAAALARLHLSAELPRAELERFLAASRDAGFLTGPASLERFFAEP